MEHSEQEQDPGSTSARTPLIAVVGATATGKSDLAIALARHLDGEVINADALQLYRGMDIGTAKLSASQRRGVPHHQLDVLQVHQDASVAAYQRRARAIIDRRRRAGAPVVLVGGSGLYQRAVVDDLRFPGTDPEVRARLEAELADLGPVPLHRRLQAADPEGASAILPSNGRRIVRALEVLQLTGAPLRANLPGPVPHYDAIWLALDEDNPTLDVRIASRTRTMFAAGLVAETQTLLQAGLRRSRTASAAVGYASVIRLLDGAPARATGFTMTEQDAVAETIVATRRLVRRQRSWLRRDPRVRWLPAGKHELLQTAVDRITGHHRPG